MELHTGISPLRKGKLTMLAITQLETLLFSWLLPFLQSPIQFPPPPGSLPGRKSPLEGSLLHSLCILRQYHFFLFVLHLVYIIFPGASNTLKMWVLLSSQKKGLL